MKTIVLFTACPVVVAIKEAPRYPKLGFDGVEVGAEWQTIHLAFPARVASTPGITYASLMPGGRQQTLEIANFRLLNCGPDFDLAKLPRPRVEYPGRSPDAPWRKAALDRIEKIRTTPVTVEGVDASAESVAGAKVRVELKRHAFGCGAAIKAKFLMGPDAGVPKYREMVDKYFSSVVLGNDLKPFGWEGGLSNKGGGCRREWTRKSLEWARGEPPAQHRGWQLQAAGGFLKGWLYRKSL
jgi:hypothetical protein